MNAENEIIGSASSAASSLVPNVEESFLRFRNGNVSDYQIRFWKISEDVSELDPTSSEVPVTSSDLREITVPKFVRDADGNVDVAKSLESGAFFLGADTEPSGRTLGSYEIVGGERPLSESVMAVGKFLGAGHEVSAEDAEALESAFAGLLSFADDAVLIYDTEYGFDTSVAFSLKRGSDVPAEFSEWISEIGADDADGYFDSPCSEGDGRRYYLAVSRVGHNPEYPDLELRDADSLDAVIGKAVDFASYASSGKASDE